MNIIISFFRDTISGFWYFLYIIACMFFIFALLGMVGDRKRAYIEEKLKEKKARDIASGKEAQIAAMESKQILDVMEDPTPTENSAQAVSQDNNALTSNATEELAKKEEAPSVLVIGADGSSPTASNTPVVNNKAVPNTNSTPLVFPSGGGEVSSATTNQNSQN